MSEYAYTADLITIVTEQYPLQITKMMSTHFAVAYDNLWFNAVPLSVEKVRKSAVNVYGIYVCG